MAEGVFTIQELRSSSGLGARGDNARAGALFVWTSDTTPFSTTLGGARACPRGSWAQSGEQRHVRTDYAGAVTPSVQVLGPRYTATTFQGSFDDRYNGVGYAVRERDRLMDMFRRGNLVRIQFQGESFVGLITAWNFEYRRSWDIGYSLTFDPHDSTRDYSLADRSPLVLTVPRLFDGIESSTQALQAAMTGAPTGQIGTTVASDTEAAIVAVSASRDALADTFDQREIRPPEKPTDALARLSSQMRIVASQAFDVSEGLLTARSDTDMAVTTAISVLSFEVWSRSVRFNARVLMGQALDSAGQTQERVDPAPSRLYRPREDESLYEISRRFYGTPHGWREIYSRNRLTSFVLTGDELLVIPERGGQAA